MNTLRFAAYVLVLALSASPAAARDVVPAFAETEVGFSPSGSAHELIIRAIQGARQSIRMAAYSFTSKDIARALVDAHKRGVDLRPEKWTPKFEVFTMLRSQAEVEEWNGYRGGSTRRSSSTRR
jgi:phosphatidylserine/phosphatidylglycerophosphate/cardiolipin synthase-like enzyme